MQIASSARQLADRLGSTNVPARALGALVACAALVQAALWICGFGILTNHLAAEVWLVILGTPLGLALTAGASRGGDALAKARAKAKALDLDSDGADAVEEPAAPATHLQQVEQCARASDLDAAEALLKQVDAEGGADVACYNAVIEACAKVKEMKRASSLVRLMGLSGLKPDSASFTSMIGGYGLAGDGPMAEVWLAQMRKAGFKPDTFVCSALISAWARDGMVERAEWALTEFQQEGIALDVVCYGAMIDAYARRGDCAMAEEWFEKMEWDSVGPDIHTYCSLIYALAAKDDIDKVEALWAKMESSGIEPTDEMYEAMISKRDEGRRTRSSSSE